MANNKQYCIIVVSEIVVGCLSILLL